MKPELTDDEVLFLKALIKENGWFLDEDGKTTNKRLEIRKAERKRKQEEAAEKEAEKIMKRRGPSYKESWFRNPFK